MYLKKLLSASNQPAWLLALSALVASATATAQPLSEALIRERVGQVLEALPTLSDEVLVPYDGEHWVTPITFEAVYTAVGDTPPVVAALPDGATRLEGQDRVVALNPERGEVRYISRARAWRFSSDSDTSPIDESTASSKVKDAFLKLGFPSEEICDSEVSTQVVAGSPTQGEVPLRHYGMYRLVTFWRCPAEGGLQVEGSEVRAAVSNHAQIQRLRIVWPALVVPPSLAFKEWDQIVEQAVEEIMAREPENGIEIRARYAYVQEALEDPKRDSPHFVPSVILTVLSPPTPYQIAITVAERVISR